MPSTEEKHEDQVQQATRATDAERAAECRGKGASPRESNAAKNSAREAGQSSSRSDGSDQTEACRGRTRGRPIARQRAKDGCWQETPAPGKNVGSSQRGWSQRKG